MTPTKFSIYSVLVPDVDFLQISGDSLKETFSVDNIVQLIDEGNIMTYVRFRCGIVFYTKASAKVRQINRELKNLSISCESSKCFPSNDQHN